MGAIQGAIELAGGLLLSAMVFVLFQYNQDTIMRFCMGMGGFAAEAYVFCAGAKNAALFLMVILLCLNALLHAMGINAGQLLRRI